MHVFRRGENAFLTPLNPLSRPSSAFLYPHESVKSRSFNEQIVRVKISGLEGGVVLIDRDGGVLLEGGAKQKRLCGESFTSVRALLATLALHSGCDQ